MIAGRWVGGAAAAAAVAILAGCGSSGAGSSSASSTAQSTSTTPTQTSSGGGTSTTVTTSGARNLAVTDAVRADLLAAGAAHNSLPVSDYTGLRHGMTYYAYDAASNTYWAGAQLVPSATSTPAQVSAQDDGGYLLFTKPAGGTWSVYSVGMAGVGGSSCPIAVPPAVLSVWGWGAGRCNPN
jgi:hypothetical protein